MKMKKNVNNVNNIKNYEIYDYDSNFYNCVV